MLMYVHMRPINDLIIQHPVASVLTMAVCLAVITAGILFCYAVIKAK